MSEFYPFDLINFIKTFLYPIYVGCVTGLYLSLLNSLGTFLLPKGTLLLNEAIQIQPTRIHCHPYRRPESVHHC